MRQQSRPEIRTQGDYDDFDDADDDVDYGYDDNTDDDDSVKKLRMKKLCVLWRAIMSQPMDDQTVRGIMKCFLQRNIKCFLQRNTKCFLLCNSTCSS